MGTVSQDPAAVNPIDVTLTQYLHVMSNQPVSFIVVCRGLTGNIHRQTLKTGVRSLVREGAP